MRLPDFVLAPEVDLFLISSCADVLTDDRYFNECQMYLDFYVTFRIDKEIWMVGYCNFVFQQRVCLFPLVFVLRIKISCILF